MEKGEQINYLGYTIKMCTNNDGIVLLNSEGSHLGNYGEDVELAKKFALINFMLDKPELKSTCVNRLAGYNGYWGDYNLLKRAIESDGLEMPSDIQCSNDVKEYDTNFMIVL